MSALTPHSCESRQLQQPQEAETGKHAAKCEIKIRAYKQQGQEKDLQQSEQQN